MALDEAAASDRDFSSVVPCSMAALLSTSLQLVGDHLCCHWCHWCPSKGGSSPLWIRRMSLLRWMGKSPQPRERVLRSDCEPQQVCVLGLGTVQSRNVCKVVSLSQNCPLGPEIEFQSQKHCWGYKLATCFISLLSVCLGLYFCIRFKL